MPTDREAREYIQTLLDIAEQGGEVDAVGRELEQLREAVQTSAAVYEQIELERRGAKRAVVETVVPLSAEQESRLAAALEPLAGAPVVIQQEANSEIIGGLRITIDDTIIDNTVRGRLQQMLESIHQAPVSIDSADTDQE